MGRKLEINRILGKSLDTIDLVPTLFDHTVMMKKRQRLYFQENHDRTEVHHKRTFT